MAHKRSRAAYEADLQAQQSPFVAYGTPLPPLDPSVRDDGSYVPVWKQEVTDERGRKRLHGAFTGGFSAGYFNTVGSKDGWTPASFVSSRATRAKDGAAPQQKPEDFMDDEDLAEQEESRKIATRDSFAGLGSTADAVAARAAPAMDLFRPAGDSAGAQLLRRMGWRDGQGIGPKVRRRARGDGSGDDEAGGDTHLFAPDDAPMIAFVRKADAKGLGFEGEAKLAAPAAAPSDSDDEPAPKPKAPRGGFGVGVLNDDGSDADDDPYAVGPRLSHSRMAGGKKAKKAKKPAAAKANPLLRHRPALLSKRNALKGAFRRCHDGRLPLSGFVLAAAPPDPLQERKHPPPHIPDGWTSSKAASPSSASNPSAAALAKASAHDPSSRAALLGEARLPGKSVFAYLTPAARSRLASLTANPALPAAGSEAPATAAASPAAPPLSPRAAAAALDRPAGFDPYAGDAPKAARYRAFLGWCAGRGPAPEPPRAPQAAADWALERAEFAQAAAIFRPVAGSMASRFTTGSGAGGGGAKAAAAAPKPLDPAVEAARLGQFGPLTRSEAAFYPSRLVCKRFGVPAPHAGADAPAGAAKGQDRDGFAARFASAGFFRDGDKELLGDARLAEIAREAGLELRPEQEKKEDVAVEPEVGRDSVMDRERPGDELFRVVFGSDSDDG